MLLATNMTSDKLLALISLVFILMVYFMYFQSVTLDKEKLLGFSQHLHPLSQT